jgi:opacity protein-like surface antigen
MESIGSVLKKVLLACVMFFVLGMCTIAHAEDAQTPKNGFYVGANLIYNTLGGDFDGDSVLTSDTEAIVVPKVDNGTGWGIVLGVRQRDVSFELGYQQSTSDASLQGVAPTTEATLHILDLDLKKHFNTTEKVQPYLLFGINIPWLVAKDCAVAYDNGVYDVSDATFYGYGLNVGGGVSYYVNPQLAVNMGVKYRWSQFASAEGVDQSGSLEECLDGSGFGLNLGVSYTF